jgi:hypothetical protein
MNERHGNDRNVELTEVGTSVEALALFTYFRLVGWKVRQHKVRYDLSSHPALVFLCDDFKTQDSILGEVHIPFCGIGDDQ